MENKKQKNDNAYKKQVFAVILAAGYSSRMGAFKPLLPIGHKPAVEHLIDALEAVGIGKIVVVSGYKKEALSAALADRSVLLADNENFKDGMFSSLQKGIEEGMKAMDSCEQRQACQGFFLNLVDSPLTPAWVLEEVLAAHKKHPKSLIVPCYKGKKGHPLFIPTQYIEEILNHDGTGGLKAITTKYETEMIRLEVDAEEVVLDMDTPEAYEELKAYYEGEEQDEGCLALLKKAGIERLILIRHGQPLQHTGKILLGQEDIGLSEKGKEEARLAGEKLYSVHFKNEILYTSDLSRARETAECIQEVYQHKNNLLKEGKPLVVIEKNCLREMHLGDWDGRLIEEIKQAYPEEFEKRGKQLLTYKRGLESENFYDLQYRVLKGFGKIIKSHKGKDLALVAHGGVIQVILAELDGIPLEEAIKMKCKTGEILIRTTEIGL